MRYISILLLLLSLQSCGVNDREKKLQESLKQVALKEQQLLKWEQELKLKEQALDQAKHDIDSLNGKLDSNVYNPAIVGRWTVKMTCKETSCEGSALGDTKTETWEVSYRDRTVLVKAYSGPVLTRVYTGAFNDELLKVIDDNPNSSSSIVVDLKFKTEKRMEGLRSIQQKDCKIVYSLDAERAK